MLPALLRKAIGDAGFDLGFEAEGGWHRFEISGLDGSAWIKADAGGALCALDSDAALRDFAPLLVRDITPPTGALGVLRCASPDELYETLRQARILVAQTPPRPEQRFQERLMTLGTTERDALVHQRIGQDLFREMLMQYWDGRCAVTGLDIPRLLRASHAKPWKDATDTERLDVHNGFLLAVHLDALFDAGLITFHDDGTGELSPLVPAHARELLLGDRPLRLSRIAEGHRPYLAYHRKHVFRAKEN